MVSCHSQKSAQKNPWTQNVQKKYVFISSRHGFELDKLKMKIIFFRKMPPGVAGRRTAPFSTDDDIHFYPTMEEFKDFNKYMEHLESLGVHEKG